MNLRAQLTGRIHIDNIWEILHHTQESEPLWVCTHFSAPDIQWLCQKQDELVDEALICPHPGRRRMLLSLICQQSVVDPPRPEILSPALRATRKNILKGRKNPLSL